MPGKRHRHKWKVYSTALCPPTIMMSCDGCGAEGSVTNFTKEEWNAAFWAPNDPHKWAGGSKRVKVVQSGYKVCPVCNKYIYGEGVSAVDPVTRKREYFHNRRKGDCWKKHLDEKVRQIHGDGSK